ncbi:Ubiquinol cytochrome-c reductase assembly protein Cbp3 [Dimargaris verticillata]|uniref:Ubiquinol cytochrome-c reductase assembly protein Cbp3 n=1 Tax=Dimargaris verticillata TaxID=2761393 RepID=A0A9W8B9K3_9FUNG|nr:Ubiquinol cytochrome-c reductase assembly protein Cbp3 [Dimargaris verticillata]
MPAAVGLSTSLRAFATTNVQRTDASTLKKYARKTALKGKVPEETELMATRYVAFSGRFAQLLGRLFGRYQGQYTAIPISANIYTQCKDLDFRDFYIDTLKLPDTYQTWFNVTQLHAWMLMVRIRNEDNAKNISQEFVNHMFYDAEMRMRRMGVNTDRLVNNTLKDLVASFHGSTLAYDEGMCRGDAYLGAAIWRNLFRTSPVRGQELAYLVHYTRRQLARLDKVSSYDFRRGYFRFDMPNNNLETFE